MTLAESERVAVLTVDGEEIVAGVPFVPAVRDAFKALPGARWSPAEKAWRVPGWLLGDVIGILRRNRIEVRPLQPWTWAEALFDEIPAQLHEAAYKALAKVVHPDVGGDARVAQQLNDAFQGRQR